MIIVMSFPLASFFPFTFRFFRRLCSHMSIPFAYKVFSMERGNELISRLTICFFRFSQTLHISPGRTYLYPPMLFFPP